MKAGWAIRCTLNAGSGRDGQDYHVRTLFTKKYRALPWPYSGCRVEADATLTGRGRVTVQILAH